jgi:hypothetical protein
MTALPLLDLAQGRRPRLRAPSVIRPRESRLHADVAALLRAHCLPDWRWTFLNRKAMNAREGAILKRMGLMPHWPDFILVSPHGSVRFLELKRISEGLSEGQAEFRYWCIGHGIAHAVAGTIDEVLAVFDHWGCLRIRVANPKALGILATRKPRQRKEYGLRLPYERAEIEG